MNWEGVNIGIRGGTTIMGSDFGKGPGDLVATILRNTTVESEFSPSQWTTVPPDLGTSSSFGGFIGYTTQWDQIVLGVDVGYTRVSSLQLSGGDTIERIVHTSDGFDNDVFIAGQSSLKLVDYGTLRGRVGYAVGQFLPYATLGGAVGRFNYARTATVIISGAQNPPTTPQQTYGPIINTLSDAKDNAFAAGFLAGAGLDVALAPNVFARAEWEFIAFGTVGGMTSTVNTLHAGLGLRF